MARCQAIPGWDTQVAARRTPLLTLLSKDICTCEGGWPEGILLWNPLGSPAVIPWKESPGRGFCYGASDSLNNVQGNFGLVPGSLWVKEGPLGSPVLRRCSGRDCIEILEALKTHLWCRWDSAQSEEPRQTPRMQVEAEYYSQMQVTCDHFSSFQMWQQQSREEALRVAREAHCWVLATVAMLKGHIEWLQHSVSHRQHWSHGHSISCQHSGSRWYLRSRGCSRSQRRHRSHRGQVASLAYCPEDPGRRWAASPSPVRPKRWVTFEDPTDTKVKQTSPPTAPNRQNLEATGSRLRSLAEEPDDLGHSPELDPCVQEFLSGTGSPGGDRDESNQPSTPNLPFDDPQEWVRWHAHWVETPAWWPELVKVPTSRDPISFARRVWPSFQFPKAKCLGKRGNDHIPLLAPHCIE